MPNYLRKQGEGSKKWSVFLLILTVLLLALGAYFYWRINAQIKRVDALQESMVNNNAQLTSIVNYINSVVASQQQQ
jgi:uncharacterized membrane protein YidH (DUF202 family)